MRRPLVFLILIILTGNTTCISQEAWKDRNRVLPTELRKFPVAILITHSPNPNYPELNDKDPDQSGKYVWKHATSVTSVGRSLEVVRAGSYIWYSTEGWQRNVQYSKAEFAKRFNCPDGQLEPGVTYTFSKNYRYGDMLYGGDALWYVIAKDANGRLYKGIGLIETESEVQE